MTGLIALIIVAVLVIRAVYTNYDELDEIPEKLGYQLVRLWEIAHQGMRENKLLRAEKALLTILKIDEKNAAAYNRLGILYAKQKEYADAIDCFEIASSIEVSASSLHNLGLIYYETGDYTKAAVAFEDALELEGDLATRHIAYAKCLEKLGNNKKMISELEKASELEPTRETMLLLQKAYEVNGDLESAIVIQKRIDKTHSNVGRPKTVNRPKRVVV